MSGVTTQHPLYKARECLRRRIRDCLCGTDRVKSRGKLYLPLPDPLCNSEKDQRYLDYLYRSYYVNLPQKTVVSLRGLVMRKSPNIELVSRLEYLEDDADGNGTDLVQMIASALDESCSLGNFGLLARQPLAEEGITRSNEGQFMPVISMYKEEQIVNWRVTNGKLTMVVLLEAVELPKEGDMFETVQAARYRVYYLNESGKVVEDIYQGKEKEQLITNFYGDDYYSGAVEVSGDWKVTSTTFEERTEIPFIFCGSIDNLPGLDPAPIENICEFALKMYMVSADEMENLHQACGGVLTISSALGMEDWQEMNGSTKINVNFGAVHLGENGAMNYVQATESTMVSSTMTRLMDMAIAQGAQIIMPDNANSTATEARINQGASLSQLGQIVQNVSQAFTWIVNKCAEMVNAPTENMIALNDEFFFEKMTPDEMRAWFEGIMKGMVTQTDFNIAMRKGGLISESRTDEDLEAELEEARLESGGDGVVTGFSQAQ